MTTDPNSIKTTCPYCGVGCGIEVTLGDGPPQVRGDPEHPANGGRLCSKGAALAETLGEEGRLLFPQIEGRRVSWDQALNHVAERLGTIIATHGPDAIAFYVSGQLLTEDYYVANKLMKGFIGSANIDTNSRLCMSSSVAGHKRAFGADIVPCNYEDLELADLVVLTGSNAAWCHPVLFQRLRAAREARPWMRIVVIDPRRTATCDIADLHLPLAPGTDPMLFGSLLDYLDRTDAVDWQYIVNHTNGYAEAVTAARQEGDPSRAAAAACGLAVEDVLEFFEWFRIIEKTVTVYSQGVNQWSFGTDKVNAIINCHLATGRIGRPGMGPFSFTGQPNAMGGREVGGLANQLAAHMDFEPANVDRVRRFWNAPRIATQPGLKAVELFEAIEAGRVKAVWIMATNPAVSLPDADRFRAALQGCELVVVSDCVKTTDTTLCAQVLLPAASWGEKEGTVTNSERCISRQRAFAPAPGEAKPDWWIITRMAQRLGFAAAFPYASPADIFREHAALSGFENGGKRDFDIGALAHIDDRSYDSLSPLQWPVQTHAIQGTPRMCVDGRFYTADQRARFIPVDRRAPAHPTDDSFPLALNTGRIRDQWHTMTRTARAPRLMAHIPEPFVAMHPQDAAAQGLAEGGLAQVISRQGRMQGRVCVTDTQRPGTVFVPMHWSDQFALKGRADSVTNPALDPISGQPEFKHTPVRVIPLAHSWQGFLFTRHAIAFGEDLVYRVLTPHAGAHRYELAGLRCPDNWAIWSRELLGPAGEWLELQDQGRGSYRGAVIREGRLSACFFVTESGWLPERTWLGKLFSATALDAADRSSLLAGRPAAGRPDQGKTVCACFNVGMTTLLAGIESGQLVSVATIGAALKAGTNCGSCIPELREILRTHGKLVA